MSVCVRLHHRAQPRLAGQRRLHRAQVVLERVGVDLEPGMRDLAGLRRERRLTRRRDAARGGETGRKQ
jgi:hypothetical protein